jgi:hypothetical protein
MSERKLPTMRGLDHYLSTEPDDGADRPHEWDADDECDRLQQINGELVEALKDGVTAVNAAIQMAQAEAQGHERVAQKHSDVVTAFRARARAVLAKAESRR